MKMVRSIFVLDQSLLAGMNEPLGEHTFDVFEVETTALLVDGKLPVFDYVENLSE